MDSWTWSRVPTSLQSESWGVREVVQKLGPLEYKSQPLQLWGTYAGREKSEHTGRGEGKLFKGKPASVIGASGPREPATRSTVDTAAMDMDKIRLDWAFGGWSWRVVRQLAISPQRPGSLKLLLVSSCRWREASAFTHCADFIWLCEAVCLLPTVC